MVPQSRRIAHRPVLWAVLFICHAGRCIRDQAPGDGDALCTDEILDGIMNPFFANRPLYSASERPLMDSRDYVRLLEESGNSYIPWQRVDRDNNNTNEEVTGVSIQRLLFTAYKISVPSSGPKQQHLHVLGE